MSAVLYIHDQRQTGRTTRLIAAAVKLQEQVPGALCLFITPYHQRAVYLSGPMYESCIEYTNGRPGLDPERTMVISSFMATRPGALRKWASGDPHHKTFAFIDDMDEIENWDRLLDALTVNGIALSAVVTQA